ncbi:MAG: nucleotide exchange factor GrpE [Candidatus Woesearchaeota archaeon]
MSEKKDNQENIKQTSFEKDNNKNINQDKIEPINQENEINTEIEQKMKKNKEQELQETLQRLQAEFENYRKRVDRDKEEFTKYSNRNIIMQIIPVLDNFQRSLDNKTKENHDGFVKAIEMIYLQLWEIMKKEGLEKIESINQKFDPELHEPLLQEESDKPENTIIEVIEEGYKLNEKILRHARVKLAKPKNKLSGNNQDKKNKDENASKSTDVKI